MEKITRKTIKENKLVKALVTVLPWAVLTGIGIVCYAVLRKDVETDFIVEDYRVQSTIRRSRRGFEEEVYEEGLLSPSSFLLAWFTKGIMKSY